MKLKKVLLSMLIMLCLLFAMSATAFAADYTGTDVYRGLTNIQPGDNLTLPKNTGWATLTANWGVRVNFLDWDRSVLKTELVPVTDTTSGSSSAPASPTRSGYIFTGWERCDANDGPATLNNDGTVTGINGPGPIEFIATFREARKEIEVTKRSDLVSGETAGLGQTITYTVTVTNRGEVTITDILVEDELEGAKLAAGESDTIARLEPGESADVHFTYVVTEADILAGSIKNTATASGTDPNGGTTNGSGDTEDSTDPVDNTLEVTKTSDIAENETVSLGDTITYTVTVTNMGNVTISNITVEDELEGAKLADGESDTITSLAPGESADVHFTYVVTEADILAGNIKNTATASGTDPNGGTTDSSGDTEDPTDPVDRNIEVTKKSDIEDGESVNLGDTITYTVTVTNKGNVTIKDITVEDELEGAKLADGETGKIASLAPGKSAEVHFTYVVTEADILAGSIKNTAIARGFDFIGIPAKNDGECEDPIEASFGSLTVKNTISGNEADSTKTFDFTVTLIGNTSINGTYGDMIFTDGVATFSLKGGESKTASYLPAGISFTVTETDYSKEGYVITKSGYTGTITAEKTSISLFTNSKSTVPNTGDESNTMLWLSLIWISAFGMTCALFSSNKKSRTTDHLRNK